MPVVSISIDSIAAGGDGVGRSNGLVVFVPRTAPADVVTAQISGKGHFARGTLSSIVTPSPVRIDPPCPHYTRDRCGGCQLQHMTYKSQIAAKQLVIRDAIQRIGKRQIDAPPIEGSPSEWRYRTKLTLSMRRRGSRWIAGLHAYDDPTRVFALADCPITGCRRYGGSRLTTSRAVCCSTSVRTKPPAPRLRRSTRRWERSFRGMYSIARGLMRRAR